MFEALRLGGAGAIGLAIADLLLSVVGGLAAVWLGTVVGRAL